MKPRATLRAMAMAAGAASIFTLGSSEAATLAIVNKVRYDTDPASGNNLATQGSVDWAYWAAATAGNVSYGANMVPTNDKTGGSAISNLSVLGTGTNLRATDGGDAAGRYTWTGGSAAPTSGTNQDLAGGLIFSSALNTTDSGISLTVTGVPGQTYYVMVYLGGFSATGNLSLTLAGIAAPVTDNTEVFGGVSPKPIVGYQIAFQPDSAGDVLNISYTATNTSTNGHVGIEAVAVSTTPIVPVPPVPEPSVALLGAAGALLLFRRRKIS